MFQRSQYGNALVIHREKAQRSDGKLKSACNPRANNFSALHKRMIYGRTFLCLCKLWMMAEPLMKRRPLSVEEWATSPDG
jgi:hypothetical protein